MASNLAYATHPSTIASPSNLILLLPSPNNLSNFINYRKTDKGQLIILCEKHIFKLYLCGEQLFGFVDVITTSSG